MLQNKQVYADTVDKCSDVRKELNEVLHKKMSKLAIMYKLAVNNNAKHAPYEFLLLKDLLYYKGGWPSETTPARIDSLVRKFSFMIIAFTFLNRTDEFTSYLDKYGISINIEKLHKNFETNNIQNIEKVKKEWNTYYPAENLPDSIQDLINFLLDASVELQSEICEKADIISVESVKHIKDKCDISKNHFINSVNIDVLKKKIKDKLTKHDKLTKKLNITKKQSEEILDSISIF